MNNTSIEELTNELEELIINNRKKEKKLRIKIEKQIKEELAQLNKEEKARNQVSPQDRDGYALHINDNIKILTRGLSHSNEGTVTHFTKKGRVGIKLSSGNNTNRLPENVLKIQQNE